MSKQIDYKNIDYKKINTGGSAIIGGKILINNEPIETSGYITPERKKPYQATAQGNRISTKQSAEKRHTRPSLRIKGIVGTEYYTLIRAAGVATINQLANVDVDYLHEAIDAINRKEKFVESLPKDKDILNWKTQAIRTLKKRRELPSNRFRQRSKPS